MPNYDRSFYQLPTNDERKNTWLKALNLSQIGLKKCNYIQISRYSNRHLKYYVYDFDEKKDEKYDEKKNLVYI